MDCKFRILTHNKETFEKLKEFASGLSEKGLIVIEAKCDFFEFLKQFDIEMLMSPFRSGEGSVDCFYYDGEIKDCNEKILEKFNTKNYEPINWKGVEKEDEYPF